jgi:hypothetical protein
VKNHELAKLNFSKLLHYSGVPERGERSAFPIPCTGFCVSCEKKGYLDKGDLRLDQMSHGADTEDFEKSICALPSGGLEFPVAFLLESPGGYYCNGRPITYEGVTKQPPVNHYYWTPRDGLTTWPTEPSEVDPSAYGPYFAYIIARHKLHYAYFTNIVKCSLAKPEIDKFVPYYVARDPDNRDSRIRNNCHDTFLGNELKLVNPEVVFYFSLRAKKMGYFLELRTLFPKAIFETLYHPAARIRSHIISLNDERISSALSRRNSA